MNRPQLAKTVVDKCRTGSSVIRIREAREGDNDALIELQKQCPQGTNLVLGIDSSPDYFARCKPFKDWHVFVACEDDSIIGSAAYAINETLVGGVQLKTAYEYGFMVDPHHRRRGIAVKLQKHIEQIAADNKIDLLHLDITEENLPSIGFFSKMGFRKVKDCAVFSLMVYRRQSIERETNIRCMKKKDINKVTDLINKTYRDYNFFTPFQTNELMQYVGRMPYFDLNSIVVYEDAEDIRACLGFWDYNKVRRYIVQRFSWRLKAQAVLMKLARAFTKVPDIPKPGESLLSYNLATLGCRDVGSVTELIKYVVNVALEKRVNFLHMPVDPESPIAAALSQFRHTRMKLHFFIKPLVQEALPDLKGRNVYIDVSEM